MNSRVGLMRNSADDVERRHNLLRRHSIAKRHKSIEKRHKSIAKRPTDYCGDIGPLVGALHTICCMIENDW